MSTLTWAEQLTSAIRQSTTRQVGAIPVLYPLVEALGVRESVKQRCWTKADIDVGRVVEVLLLNRLMSPLPLYHVGEWAERTVVTTMFGLKREQLHDQRFGRGLEELHGNLGPIWTDIMARAIGQEGLDLSVLHWDLTTLHLAGAYEASELAQYGRDSEGRLDHKLVKLGLSVTHQERAPLLYAILAGNTADNTTPVPFLGALATFLHQLGWSGQPGQPLVVGDCKMITAAAVARAHAHHFSYLGPWAADKQSQAVIRNVSPQEWERALLAYRPRRRASDATFVAYRGVWRPFPVSYEGRTYHDRALVVWSAGKEKLDQDKRKQHLKRLLNRLAEIKGYLNQGKYQKREYTAHQIALAQRGNSAKGVVAIALTGTDSQLQLDFHIDRAALALAMELDGKYLLATNATDLSANEALTLFKGQDGVEKRYAAIKGPLQVRPLYLHSDERIESLVFVNILALLVRALLELRCGRAGYAYTADRVLDLFAPLYATDQTFVDGSRYTQLDTVTQPQQQLLTALHFPDPNRYLHPLAV